METVDNDVGPNLRPLARSAFVSLVVTEISAITRKMSRLATVPPVLFTDISWAPRANVLHSRLDSPGIRRLCSSLPFFISDNIYRIDESGISSCLSETWAPTIFAVSRRGLRRWRSLRYLKCLHFGDYGEGFLYRSRSSLKYFPANICNCNCIDKVSVLF